MNEISLAECYYRVAADMEANANHYLGIAEQLNRIADRISERDMASKPMPTPDQQSEGKPLAADGATAVRESLPRSG